MTRFQPESWPSVIPRIFVADTEGLVDYLVAVFGAEGSHRDGAPVK